MNISKLAKKEAKKVVQNARTKVYKEVCEKLDTKEVEKDIYRIARIRERKTRDLCIVTEINECNNYQLQLTWAIHLEPHILYNLIIPLRT